MVQTPVKPMRSSLRGKLTRVMFLTLALLVSSIMAMVVWKDLRSNEQNLAHTQQLIREQLDLKGQLLTENHALALRGLVADNAYTDVEALVRRAVASDDDVVYGLFLSSEGKAWIYLAPDETTANEPHPAARQRWRQLKLPDEALTGKGLHRRAISRFGLRIQEFAMPVAVEDERLGTIVYGISTTRMDNALAQASSRAQQQLMLAMAGLLALLAVNGGLAFLLIRRAATRISSPVGDLTRAAAQIAAGHWRERAAVHSGDEVEVLANAFNDMVGQLASSQQGLEQLNGELESKVEARTAQLAERNQDMRRVLDNVGQGFITLDAEGQMALEHSTIVERWLGSYQAGGRFHDYTAPSDAEFADAFEFGMQQIFAGWLPLAACIDQLPSRLKAGRLQLEVSYVDLGAGVDFAGLLIVIADITDQLAHRAAEREQSEILASVQRLMYDRNGFLEFYRSAERQVRAIVLGDYDGDQIQLERVVHTLKGNASLMGLAVLSELCHELENAMEEHHGPAPKPLREPLLARWSALTEALMPFLGSGSDGAVTVEHSRLVKLAAELERAGMSELSAELSGWRLEPLSVAFGRLAEQARQAFLRLRRGPLQIDVFGEDIRVDPTIWNPFWMELAHVIRNAIDHGFTAEPPAPDHAPARISLGARMQNEDFIIEVTDNGRGIDWPSVQRKATALKIAAGTRAELEAALFSARMSTRDEVSLSSGRGVGLSAVRARCLAMSGRIEVRSEAGEGAQFRFVFPAQLTKERLPTQSGIGELRSA